MSQCSPGPHLDPIALAAAWEAKRAAFERAEAARSACWEELSAACGFDQLSDNERAKVAGVERYYALDELSDELRDEAHALAALIADAPCRTPRAAAATLRVAAELMREHQSREALLLRRVDEDSGLWAGVPPRRSG